MNKRIVTQQEVKSELYYDQITGKFTRIATGKKLGSIGNHGYLVICAFGANYLAHRLAWLYMTGEWPEHTVDHKDNNKLNNAFSNLREATNSENARNREKYKNNKLGVKGVYFEGKRNKYKAICWEDGKQKTIGRFATQEMASQAYQHFASQVHGDFYRNSIQNIYQQLNPMQ
ncbi:MAG: HNH endonuclease [Pseudomonadota bacterium]